jgi:outer membrane receptor protein involved in Fe transport
MKISRLLTATALASAGFAIPQVAWAQAAPTTQETEEASTTDEDVVVTGSRIRRPNIEANVPVTSITAEDIFNQGQTNIGDTLNDLPQLRSTFAQQNPGAGVGITGLNLLDLRGLGTVRTLVLVNGRRHVAADILNNASSVDVSSIPNDLLERVEIVTGGNSAVYGSDAIAGVVNFILKRDFEGLQVRGSAAVSEEGFGGNQYASIMAGKNFADGRGNITAHVEYAHQRRVYASDIPWYRRADGFAVVDSDTPGLPQASDGFPDNIFLQDIRANNSITGMVVIPQPQGAGARCGAGTLANNGAPNNLGTSFSCAYIFSGAGALTPVTGTRVGAGPLGTLIGGNAFTGREGTGLSILPSNQRINANLLARFEFSPALEAFLEAKYVRTDSVGNQLGPTFLNGSSASLNDARINMRLDNPFLNPADRTSIASAITASGCGYAFGTAVTASTCQAGTPAQQAARAAAIADGSYRFLFARTLSDSPDRDEIFRRNTYRVVGGLRGTFNEDWSYEVSANYGRFEETTDMRGFVDKQRFYLALDAGRATPGGPIQCRSQFDPASAVGLAGNAAAAAKLAADIAACVPYNPFGAANNAAAVNYFKANIINRAWLEQVDILGYVSGDLSQLFSLPGGPIRFVVGGEYRREKVFNDSDSAADTGLSNAVFLGDFDPEALTVKEAYGEIEIPLFKDIFLLNELTLSAAGRVSEYNNSAGTTYTYNLGAQWSPFAGLRFRANYGRAVRAPNVTETGTPPVPNFANAFIDPCNVNAIANNAIRTTNCQAQLSAAQLANLAPAGYTLGIISGSNPNLSAEKSDSYTYGVVYEPSFMRGFSISADYYNITVNDVIVSLAAQTIVNSCYDSPGLTSPLCGVFARQGVNGASGTQGELSGQIINNSLVSGPQNFARRKRRGLDIEAAYRGEIGSGVKVNTRLIYTHLFQSSNYENPALPDFENILMRELGDPQDEARFDLDLTFGQFTVGYQAQILGAMLVSTYENSFPSNAGVPGSTGLPLNSDVAEILEYPRTVYHDIRLNYRVGSKRENGSEFNLYFGVDNVTGVKPPWGTTATGAGTSIYQFRGRNFYAGVRANF